MINMKQALVYDLYSDTLTHIPIWFPGSVYGFSQNTVWEGCALTASDVFCVLALSHIIALSKMASWLLVGFWTLTGLAIVFAAVLTRVKAHLPQTFQDLLFYGKVRGKRTKWSVIQLLEVPKRYDIGRRYLGTRHGYFYARGWQLLAK